MTIFYFADMYNIISTFYYDINLSSRRTCFASPRVTSINFWCINVMRPILLFHFCSINKGKIEKAKEVANLIDSIFFLDFLFTYNILLFIHFMKLTNFELDYIR